MFNNKQNINNSGFVKSQPFLISNKKKQHFFNVDDEVFDQTVESKVRFVQGVNAFLTIKLTYDSIKMCYSFWQYMDSCQAYSNLMIGFLACNVLWIIASIIGFNSINTKKFKSVKLYFILLFIVFLTRISLYIVMGLVMEKHMIVKQTTENIVCSSIYQEGLLILEACIEGVLLLVLLALVRAIYVYLKVWDQKSVQDFFENNKFDNN